MISNRATDCRVGWITMAGAAPLAAPGKSGKFGQRGASNISSSPPPEPAPGFILNMTSDSKVREIVRRVRELAARTVAEPPEMSWFDGQCDPADDPDEAYAECGEVGGLLASTPGPKSRPIDRGEAGGPPKNSAGFEGEMSGRREGCGNGEGGEGACGDEKGSPVPFLPFSAFLITGTAGAGKSTSISALHQNLNCLVTGATTVAAQNLSRGLRAYCPTIFNAFGFKGRHINFQTRVAPQHVSAATMAGVQRRELCRYWPVISDITQDFTRRRQKGQYATLGRAAFNTLVQMGPPSLWTTNIIVIDEAGTLSSHILSAVVYFYWLYNSWLETPLYRAGAVPCIVCVGSPTQTEAFQSTFNHSKQKHHIAECDNVLSFLIGNPVVAAYAGVGRNWALFINNKRCVDPEFGHLLKTLEYDLDVAPEVMTYVDRFVVPRARILNPFEFVGWTRLFLSHGEVKAYLVSLHSALATGAENAAGACLFSCPIVCEVFTKPFLEYRATVNLPSLSPVEWLTRNLSRLSNYSQFVDQDMVAAATAVTDRSTRVTYTANFVRNSYISVNGKTKKCICGYMGTFARFRRVLESDTFIDAHAHEQPEFAYSFLNTLIYNGLYSFYRRGLEAGNSAYLCELVTVPLPPALLHDISPSIPGEDGEDEDDVGCTGVDGDTEGDRGEYGWFETGDPRAGEELGPGGAAETPGRLRDDEDIFYHRVPRPPSASSASLPTLIELYHALKRYFLARMAVAERHLGADFVDEAFYTFTVNMVIRDGVDFSSPSDRLPGLLDFASTVESYRLKGYTFLRVNFGRYGRQEEPTQDSQSRMPTMVVEDSGGFVACLENNVTKMSETLENGNVLHMCSVSDYGISSKLSMTVTKAQGLSLDRVAVSFGNHRNVRKSHVYVAISRATDPNCLVMDRNPLRALEAADEGDGDANFRPTAQRPPPKRRTAPAPGTLSSASKHIIKAMHNPDTLLVY
ncbi:DNA helicase-primase complex component [Eptesicus fuscus gammaherpesvirus]|uniref:DNA helicase-primase complex component n=1 Tax=vespertilionid gammaherpesvirus 3 TaxID=2846598 RepID=A0A2D0ZMJ5_9GAMA|nr:DNA helicase-primase complex component [Eptesicus fuscus gammaherpesvirus]ATA58273.1 DNA helicase-primase complex component [Eptesicus fuscus gammaherpesvirus]WAH70889.1 DNA replication helicase [Eptesicus fuscus gammaherpesvirus]